MCRKTNTVYYEHHIILNNIKQITGILTLILLLQTVTTKIEGVKIYVERASETESKSP